MKITDFLTVSGALVLGIVAITIVTFPLLAVFIAFGYMAIKEHLNDDNDDKDEEK